MEFVGKIKERLKILTSNVDKTKSNLLGEVFTPLSLVEKMIDKIPSSFWKCPKNKILDNSVGYGNFTIILIEKLMDNLEMDLYGMDRYKHIMENMLYFCDIQEESKKVFEKLFVFENIKIKFHLGSFLEESFDDFLLKNNIKELDLIIGNPPYNARREDKTNGNVIWDKFVLKSYNISKKLCMVHPSVWRKPYSKTSKLVNILDKFKKGNLVYLNMNSNKEGKKVFKAGTSFDYYYFEKYSKYIDTLINDHDNVEKHININEYPFIPNKNLFIIDKFFKNGIELKIIFNSMYHAVRDYVRDEMCEEYKYPLIHSTPKKGVVKKWSKINNKGHFGIKKIILGESGVDNMIIDYDGLYGMTQGAMGIDITNYNQKDIDKIFSFFKNEFSLIRESCKWSNFRIDHKMVGMIRI